MWQSVPSIGLAFNPGRSLPWSTHFFSGIPCLIPSKVSLSYVSCRPGYSLSHSPQCVLVPCLGLPRVSPVSFTPVCPSPLTWFAKVSPASFAPVCSGPLPQFGQCVPVLCLGLPRVSPASHHVVGCPVPHASPMYLRLLPRVAWGVPCLVPCRVSPSPASCQPRCHPSHLVSPRKSLSLDSCRPGCLLLCATAFLSPALSCCFLPNWDAD